MLPLRRRSHSVGFRLIDEAFERALDADGLTRRHWQVLNTLAAGPSTNAALTAALRPFVEDDAKAVEVVNNDFLGRGWVRNVPDVPRQFATAWP
jgi:hypothetical protein